MPPESKVFTNNKMSHTSNSIEVEQQFWVTNIESVQAWVKQNALFKYTNHQVDDYFTPAHSDYFAKKFPNEFFRVRNADGKFSTTFKYWYESDDQGHHSHCDEYETKVEDGEQFKKILQATGFTVRVTVDKIRTSYSYKNFEINIDVIKNLGSFCEIEIQGDYDSVADAQKQIEIFAKEIGIHNDEGAPDMTCGYAMMLFRKQEQISN
jgi:adenylate cyclase, class 2